MSPGHAPVLLEEVLSFVPEGNSADYLDVTAGGGGHFFAIAAARPGWRGECWDRDPQAAARLSTQIQEREGFLFRRKCFGEAPENAAVSFRFILADIGVSSFQLDEPQRGMSFRSEAPPDFRMDPTSGLPFRSWLKQTPEFELARIFQDFGEEPKAKRLAHDMKAWKDDAFISAAVLAERIRASLGYRDSRHHPATRIFQAMRIAINDELGELKRFLSWAPQALEIDGVLAVISFHSLEDRLVKNCFRDLAISDDFDILTKKPLVAGESELNHNPRSRSAKLRALKRLR